MRVHLSSAAHRDIAAACSWYEAQTSGQGGRFLDAIDETVERVQQYPKANPLRFRDLRSANIVAFPYKIWYRIEDETIAIYAVAHTSRDPDYWIERL